MSFHAILALTRPTDTETKKARIVEEIVTMAEAVFTKGMLIQEDKEELEEEQEMWTARWDCRLIHGGALRINWELTGLQDLLQVSLQKARDHSIEPQVASVKNARAVLISLDSYAILNQTGNTHEETNFLLV